MITLFDASELTISVFCDVSAKAKYLVTHRPLEMARCPSLCFKFLAPDGKKFSIIDIGTALVSLQNMAWQVGYYLEGVPYRESGTHRKEILQKYDLLFRDIRKGSIDVEIVPSEWTQATLEEDATLPGYRAMSKLTDVFEKIERNDRKSLTQVIKDSAYRARLLDEASNIIPAEEDYSLLVTGEGGRKFTFKSVDRERISHLKEAPEMKVGLESRIGVLAQLRVDGGKDINLERLSDKERSIEAEYSIEIEREMRDLLGHPALAFGQAQRDKATGAMKVFKVFRVEPLKSIELPPFQLEGLSFAPIRKTFANVDYIEGEWRLSIPVVNAVGYGDTYERALDKLKEHLYVLWDEFVNCDDSVLGETGVLLRKLLIKLFKVS
jgi:hypothetical protein